MNNYEFCEKCDKKVIDFRVIEDDEGNTIYCEECYKKRKDLDDSLKEFVLKNKINLAKFYKSVEKECKG
jgi:hypothetical protein